MNKNYPLALPPGTVLAGQYVIEKVLGQGGFGITYEAIDHKTSRKVAVKEFFPDALATRTNQMTVTPFTGERGENYEYGKTGFLQEAETLAQFIGNENIVRIYSYFEENGTAYFVMEFIEGTSFDEYLKQHGGKISYEEAARVLTPVMDALGVVHSKGIVHRDVTPDNIYITNDGVVKLLDFGAARYSLGDKSRSLDIILKHGFAPKEQYTRRGKQGPYTDVYSLGASFYFAMTGKRPQDSIERMDEDDLVPPSALGVRIGPREEDAILKALGIQPTERFQSMAEFKRALIGDEQGTAKTPPAGSETTVKQTFFSAPEETEAGKAAAASGQAAEAAPIPGPGAGNAAMAGQIAGSALTPPPARKEAPAKAAAEKKPLEKKKLYIMAAAAAVVILGIFMLKPGKKTTDNTGSPRSPQAVAATEEDRQETVAVADSRQETEEVKESRQETEGVKESQTPPKDTGNASEDWSVLGNSIGNLMNGGICAVYNGKKLYLADNSESVKITEDNDRPYIFDHVYNSPKDSYLSGLSVVGDTLYFLSRLEGRSSAGMYDLTNPGEEGLSLVPGLDDFQGYIQRLLVLKDYYVILSSYDNAVYRVSRTTGESVKCCTVWSVGRYDSGFTLSKDGWLYYVQQDGIYCMRIDTLEAGPNLVPTEGTGLTLSSPIVVGDYIYYLAYLNDDFREYGIIRSNRWQGIGEADPVWPLSQELGLAMEPGFTSFNVNQNNHDIYFYTRDTGNAAPHLYQIKGYEDGTFDYMSIAEDAYAATLFYNNDNGSYSLLYLRGIADEAGNIVYQTRTKSFDADGNPIEN
ncbi:MAG: protein kinase [Lachnospiraceae bacterium]|jgi:hypothetical protein|nr:protein kinase [Lachnospiraceae bacterium]